MSCVFVIDDIFKLMQLFLVLKNAGSSWNDEILLLNVTVGSYLTALIVVKTAGAFLFDLVMSLYNARLTFVQCSIQTKWKIYNLTQYNTHSIVLSLLYSCFAKKFVIRREAVKSIVCYLKWYEKHLSVFITAYKILCLVLYFEYTLIYIYI